MKFISKRRAAGFRRWLPDWEACSSHRDVPLSARARARLDFLEANRHRTAAGSEYTRLLLRALLIIYAVLVLAVLVVR